MDHDVRIWSRPRFRGSGGYSLDTVSIANVLVCFDGVRNDNAICGMLPTIASGVKSLIAVQITAVQQSRSLVSNSVQRRRRHTQTALTSKIQGQELARVQTA
jgi:hypothetical protein